MDIGGTIGISILSAIVATYLTYWLGFRQYLKQKEREEIIRSYIGGVGRLIALLDQAYFNCEFNYAKAIRIIEYIEKAGGQYNIEEEMTKKLFLDMKSVVIAPEATPIYMLLIISKNNKIVEKWIVEMMADYLRFSDYLSNELYLELKLYFQHIPRFGGKTKETFLKELIRRLTSAHKESLSLNEPLRGHLVRIKTRIDEKRVSNMKEFMKLAEDKEIKEIIKDIETDYKEKNQTKQKVEELIEK